MGLNYKENVSDAIEIPANTLKGLIEFGVKVFGFDPLLQENQIKKKNLI